MLGRRRGRTFSGTSNAHWATIYLDVSCDSPALHFFDRVTAWAPSPRAEKHRKLRLRSEDPGTRLEVHRLGLVLIAEFEGMDRRHEIDTLLRLFFLVTRDEDPHIFQRVGKLPEQCVDRLLAGGWMWIVTSLRYRPLPPGC